MAILAVNMGESEDQVNAYVARHGLSFPHLMDPGAKAEEAFGIQATPTNFLVDRRGHVVAGGMGYRDLERAPGAPDYRKSSGSRRRKPSIRS